MSKRADAIADRIEQGGEALASYCESLSDAQWKTVVPVEERTPGVVVHHVATLQVPLVEWAGGLAAGQPLVGVTWDDIDAMNAQHAEENANISKQEATDLLRANTKTAADMVRQYTDEQLDNAATVCLYWDTPLSAQWFIEYHSVRHSFNHLDNIRRYFES
jgi:hypothetical protein